MNTLWRPTIVATLLAFGLVGSAAPAAAAGPEPKEVKAVLEKAVAYLKKAQNEDGSFSAKVGPGVTALIVAGLIRNGWSADDPVVAKGLAFMEKKIQKDGGIYDKGLANYTTSVALLALVEANKDGKYDKVIKNATAFLKKLQIDESAVEEKDPTYGGVGYDGKSRPDLSNTQMFVEALLAAGVPKDDPAVQRALKFISRCQNLAGENNDQPFAKKASADDKGGLTYKPTVDKDDPRATAEGGLRSAGTMTYAGLKSFLHAGVKKDDPRVEAAIDWIRRHYTLEENPGQKQAGLYYYYHLFGKAMDAIGEDLFVDSKKVKHDWRKDLFDALKSRQKTDGSWVNSDRHYMEDNPDLATAFAILSLSYCKAR